MNDKPTVLVLSAGDFAREGFVESITCCGCQTNWVGPTDGLPRALLEAAPDVILADEDAAHLRPLLARHPDTPLILATQTGRSRPHILHNVFRKLTKPVTYAQIVLHIERALAYRRVAIDCWQQPIFGLAELLGASDQMQPVYEGIDRLAELDENTLVTGERGVGRGLVARAIHARSSGEALHTVDCAGLSHGTFVSELLDPLRAQADAGIGRSTVLLSEVGTLSHSLQDKLLTALRERGRPAAGPASGEPLSVRVLATTSDPLEKLAEEDRFHPQLPALLSAQTLNVPPLRDRTDDVLFLARRIVERLRDDPALPAVHFPPATEALMLTYPWPGNIRELRKVVARAAVLANGLISPSDLDLPHPSEAAIREATTHVMTNRARATVTQQAFMFDMRRKGAERAG